MLRSRYIEARNLYAYYGSTVALEDVSLKLDGLEFVTLIGPNGAGKTTLIKAILGLLKSLRGSISVFGYDPLREPEAIRKLIGYVPQHVKVSPLVPLTSLEVVLMGILPTKKPPRVYSERDIELALKALEVVGMLKYKDASIHELSGGQKQRVFIARAIVREPKYLILDEPFTGVDVKAQREIAEFIYNYHKERKVGVLVSAHDIAHLVEFSDEVVLLNKRVISVGKLNEVLVKENIKKAYGAEVRILEFESIRYPLLGDTHGA